MSVVGVATTTSAASARSQPVSGAQSSSVKARNWPRACAAPRLRAAAGPAFDPAPAVEAAALWTDRALAEVERLRAAARRDPEER